MVPAGRQASRSTHLRVDRQRREMDGMVHQEEHPPFLTWFYSRQQSFPSTIFIFILFIQARISNRAYE